MKTFKHFIEQEVVPTMGGDGASPPLPSEGGDDTHNDSSVLAKELGIRDKDMKMVDQTKTFLCLAPLEFPADGVKVLPPTDVTVMPIDDNNETFKLTVRATNPRKIQDLSGTDYKGGKLEFSKEVDKKTVEAIKGHGWTSGGAPPMGGNMPPMGGMGGIGGGIGGPPMMSHTEYPTFEKWISLKEVGTSTGDVAVFSRMTLPMVRRTFPNTKKKKPYQVPQVES